MSKKLFQHYVLASKHFSRFDGGNFHEDAASMSKLQRITRESLRPGGAKIIGNITFEAVKEDDMYVGTVFSNINGKKIPLLTTFGARTEKAAKILWKTLQNNYDGQLTVTQRQQHRLHAPFVASYIFEHPLPDEQACDFVFSGMCGRFCDSIGLAFLFPETLKDGHDMAEEDSSGGMVEYGTPDMATLDRQLDAFLESPKMEDARTQGNGMRSHPDMNGIASRSEMLDEAVRRMEALGFAQETIDSFRKSGKLDSVMEDGRIFPLEPADQDRIRDFEEKEGCLAYAAIRGNYYTYRMMNYIMVSSYKADWYMERTAIAQRSVCAYVYNYDIPTFSGVGFIIIKRLPGGMFRRMR